MVKLLLLIISNFMAQNHSVNELEFVILSHFFSLLGKNEFGLLRLKQYLL